MDGELVHRFYMTRMGGNASASSHPIGSYKIGGPVYQFVSFGSGPRVEGHEMSDCWFTVRIDPSGSRANHFKPHKRFPPNFFGSNWQASRTETDSAWLYLRTKMRLPGALSQGN